MIQQTVLQRVIDMQKNKMRRFGTGFSRGILPDLPVLQSHALIVTGIHHCGKSNSGLLRTFARKP